MRKLLFFMVVVLCSKVANAQSLYGIQLNNIDGVTINLSSYQGKKIIFFIVPRNFEDTSRINELSRCKQKYDTSVQIIGIVATNEGYTPSQKADLKNAFASVTGLLFTEPTTVNSSTQQNALCKWLMHKSENKRFDTDYIGSWQKFLVDENGILYTTLIPIVGFDSKLIEFFMQLKNN